MEIKHALPDHKDRLTNILTNPAAPDLEIRFVAAHAAVDAGFRALVTPLDRAMQSEGTNKAVFYEPVFLGNYRVTDEHVRPLFALPISQSWYDGDSYSFVFIASDEGADPMATWRRNEGHVGEIICEPDWPTEKSLRELEDFEQLIQRLATLRAEAEANQSIA